MTTARMLATRHLSLLVFDHRMDLRNRPLLCMSTGSPKVLGDPARVLSRLRPLARGQRGGGPRTYPGPVHCLGRPLVVCSVRLSGVPSPPHAARVVCAFVCFIKGIQCFRNFSISNDLFTAYPRRHQTLC